MERPGDMLERAQAAARRLGQSSPAQRSGPLAAALRALYDRWEATPPGEAAARDALRGRPAYPEPDPDVPEEERVTLGGLRAELADELAKLATRREPPAAR